MLKAERLFPGDILSSLEKMRKEDMKSYIDDAGKIKSKISYEISECLTCGSKEREHAFKKEAFDYYRCKNCGLVYVAPRLSDEALDYLYTKGRSVYQTEHMYLPSAEFRKENIYKRKLKVIEGMIKHRHLLDLGSSAGYFLQAAQERGWDASGIELNEFGVNWAINKLGVKNVYQKLITECGFEKKYFDVMTMWDVLEHIPNPLPVLKDMHPYLKDDGVIIIETSHYDCYETNYLGSENTNMVGDLHLMHFTLKSMEELARRAGYEIIENNSFGLDIQHIISYHKINNTYDVDMPNGMVSSLQSLIDESGKGCYIRVVLRKL